MAKAASVPAIRLRGVRHNNLKGFDLDLPAHRLIVITGLSGSGKSSLAFDTLYAEGQRRYLETFSPYARQFFDRMDKPRVDRIEGIPPAIALEQRNAVRTTRSTVGTMTEICDHLKVLWPHLAQLHCRGCGRPVRKDPPAAIWESLVAELRTPDTAAGAPRSVPPDTAPECLITFDLPLSEKLSLAESLALVARQGYARLLVGDRVVRVEEARSLAREPAAARAGPKPADGTPESGGAISLSGLRHLTVVQDRLRLVPAARARFLEACEQAYHFGQGRLAVHFLPLGVGAVRRFSNRRHCAECDLEYTEPTPALFSFNHPLGACPTCKGFGRIISIDYDRAVPDRSLTLAQGAVRPWRSGFSAECQADLAKFCRARGVPMNVPFRDLAPEHQRWVLEGDPDYGVDEEHEWPRAWYGVKGYFRWLESKAYKMHVRVLLSRYRAYTPCPDCGGRRLKPEALLYRLPLQNLARDGAGDDPGAPLRLPASLNLAEFYALPLREAWRVVDALWRSRTGAVPGRRAARDPLDYALAEVRARLGYLVEIGLGYLTLDRPTRTLSGGETERVNLTTCLGTRLVNTLFVLDEPTVGLHPRDTLRLVRLLERLRDAGNTVVVVEHEPAVMRAADRIVDLGPGHGETGGQVVCQGTYRQVCRCRASLTGQYLSGRRRIEIPPRRPVRWSAPPARREPATWLSLTGVTRHNLRDLAVDLPLGRLVCVTGVSGSGKSTLIREVLYPALRERLGGPGEAAPAGDRLEETGDTDGEDDEIPSRPAATELALAGWEVLGRVALVDQAPLGRTPRSNPAVYVGAFDDLRELFAASEAARQRGLNASAFSFNSAQGQCERCRGAGFEQIEMQFLSDVFIRCPDCDGRRYRPHILEVRIRPATGEGGGEAPARNPESTVRDPRAAARGVGRAADRSPNFPAWSIAEVLEATVEEVQAWLGGFGEMRAARRAAAKLRVLLEVGLGYLRLGQPLNTLSGGECQRLKLAAHLAEHGGELHGLRAAAQGAAARPTLFLFDEPTTGLHFEDVRVLLGVFQRLVDAGHSVVVIEHNLEVIKCADWVIDLGPEAGAEGGRVVVCGPPEVVAACPASHTGRALREVGLSPAGEESPAVAEAPAETPAHRRATASDRGAA